MCYCAFRTGNRTKAGALQDLQNSIVRYVKNNFLDGTRQVRGRQLSCNHLIAPHSWLFNVQQRQPNHNIVLHFLHNRMLTICSSSTMSTLRDRTPWSITAPCRSRFSQSCCWSLLLCLLGRSFSPRTHWTRLLFYSPPSGSPSLPMSSSSSSPTESSMSTGPSSFLCPMSRPKDTFFFSPSAAVPLNLPF